MRRIPVGVRALLLVLAGLVAAYPFESVPVRVVSYEVVGLFSVVTGYAGVRYHQPARRRGWLLVLAGFLGWVVGDVVSVFERDIFGFTGYPAPSDWVYMPCYALIGAGCLALTRGRSAGRDLNSLLDASIIASGFAVVVGVFVISPIADDPSLDVLSKVVSSAYPVGDVLLLGILVRLWATAGARATSLRLLAGALISTLVADLAYNTQIVATLDPQAPPWNEVLWLAGYVALAAAGWSTSRPDLSEPVAVPAGTDQRRRLVLVGVGLSLPALTLVLDGLTHAAVSWRIIAIGSLVLSVLALSRMAGLLGTVQVQAVQLAALARADGLTGAPNRRTWDHELSRACQLARTHATPLVVALLDLDRFKVFNDTYGHQAGDRLLREAVAAWSELLAPGEMLARYGGEEFALLFPGLSLDEAGRRVDRLRAAMPAGQTFSAGLATWDPATDPAAVVAAADDALYVAKGDGRDRVVLAGRPATEPVRPTIVLQPIVDLTTGVTISVEALSRFSGQDPAAVFRDAYLAGRGLELEAAAVEAALHHRSPHRLLSVNVSVEALVSRQVLDVLPADLHGVVLEITEHTEVDDWTRLERVLGDLRARGVRLAIDDWGRGYSNLGRLLQLRPELLKIDISLVHALHSDYHRALVRSITAWAHEVGAQVCAEGVESAEQRLVLLDLGVHSGQGWYFGAPRPPLDDTGAGDPATGPVDAQV